MIRPHDLRLPRATADRPQLPRNPLDLITKLGLLLRHLAHEVVPQRAVLAAVGVRGPRGVVHQRQAAALAHDGGVGGRVVDDRPRRVRPDPEQARVETARPPVLA